MGRNFCLRHLVARTQKTIFHSVLSLVYDLAIWAARPAKISEIGQMSSGCGISALSELPFQDMVSWNTFKQQGRNDIL